MDIIHVKMGREQGCRWRQQAGKVGGKQKGNVSGMGISAFGGRKGMEMGTQGVL